jgi:hypothetical protein
MEVCLQHRCKGLPPVNSAILRLAASPPLPPHVLDEVSASVALNGHVLAAVNDPDINATAISVGISDDSLGTAIDSIATRCGGILSAGRAFRFEILSETPDELTDETIRGFAVSLHGAFSAPVFLARRDVPAAAWAMTRPMPWGRKGLAVGQTAPSLPFGGSACPGVAIEVGLPTILAKARLDTVPEHGLLRACAAVGGAESGFADVGAYPAVSAADGASVVVLEFGNPKRSPLHRTLAVLDIEARRFGGRLGQAAVLSHVPLDALLDALKANIGLDATRSQVLETHLPAAPAR